MKVSCIIPAYNEATRIEAVLEVVQNHPKIGEVIVVDDASKDDTSTIVRKFENIKLITNTTNQGKSASIHTGIKEASSDYLLFLDADLVGLNSENISKLIEPIENNSADVSISLRKNSPAPWHWIGLDYISGERVLNKKLLENKLDTIKTLPGFGLEVFLNSLIIKNKQRIAVVPWANVESPFKHSKYGIWSGVTGDIKMMLEIFKVIGVLGAIKQIMIMLKLKQKYE